MISRLQDRGLTVVSVQLPLTSLAEDVAAVERAIALHGGPLVLVGHSWGGAVITQAGTHERVAALVYVSAFAPDIGESVVDLQGRYAPPAYAKLMISDSAGFLWFPQSAFGEYVAQDIPRINWKVVAAAQKPIRATAFLDKLSEAAWRGKPSSFLIADADRMIDPVLQRAMADHAKGRVTIVHSSHVPFASRPKETTAIILEAVDHV